MTDLLDLLTGMHKDLAEIHRSIGWAEGYGYGKPGRGLDAEHGMDLARSEAERLAGPTFDIGLGDHGARLALQRALPRLSRAEVLLIIANATAGWTKIASSYGMVAYGELPTPNHMTLSCRIIDTLLTSLEEHLPNDPLPRRRVERWAFKASQQLQWCLVGFSRALDKGEVAKPSTAECKNGGCKNLASMKVMEEDNVVRRVRREAGLCDRCARFRRRNGVLPSGHRLSAELDREPWKNQNKRRANGIDGGDESLSWALRDG